MSNEYTRLLEQLFTDLPIRETEGIEFKPSLPWNLNKRQVKKIMRAILAFSNKNGGGKIILGIPQDDESHGFINAGMNDSDYKSFADADMVYQETGNYGVPAPLVEIKRTEFNEKKYVIFNVREFYSSPVICKRNLQDDGDKILEKSALYIRTPKPECKKVEYESEMRLIVDLAVNKEIMRFSERIAIMSKRQLPDDTDADKTKFDKEINEGWK